MLKIKTNINTNTNTRTKNQASFSKFAKNHLQDFVEVSSYLSGSKLYGVISESDNVSLTLTITYLDEEDPKYNETESLYIPLNSIKYIKKL